MRAFASLLLLATVATAETFEVSSSVPELTFGTRGRPRIAASNDGYLVGWLEWPDPGSVYTTKPAVHATLVDRDGKLTIDRDLIVGGDHPFQVASNGSDYLIARAECEDRNCNRSMTRFLSVTVNGDVYPGVQTVIGTPQALASVGGMYVAVAGQRAPYCLVVVDSRGVVMSEPIFLPGETWWMDVKLAEMPDGRVAIFWTTGRHARFAIASLDDLFARRIVFRDIAQTMYEALDVSATSDGFVVVWRDGMVALDRSGAVVGDVRRSVFPRYDPMTLASTGSRHLFIDYAVAPPPGSNSILQYRLINFAGELGAKATPFPQPAQSGMEDVDAATVRDGDGAVVVFLPRTENLHLVRLARVDRYGDLDPRFGGTNIARRIPTQTAAVVARCGFGYAVAWVEPSLEHDAVRYRRFTRDGVPFDPAGSRVTVATGWEQRGPSVACAGDMLMIVWIESRLDPATGIAAVRYRGALFGTGVAVWRDLDLGTTSDFTSTAMVSSSETDFLVLLGRTKSTELRRLTSAGEPAAATSILPALRFPSMAWNADRGLLTWLGPTGAAPSIQAVLFDRDLRTTSAELVLPQTGSQVTTRVRIASSPDRWLLAWGTQSGAFCCPSTDAHTLELTGDLTPLDPSGASAVEIAYLETPAGAAWNGCAWEVFLADRFLIRKPHGVGYDTQIEVGRRVVVDDDRRFVVATVRNETGVPRLAARIEPVACMTP